MPRRTMTVTEIWVHTKGDRRERKNLSELPDGDLLHLFRSFAVDLPPDALHHRATESYALVMDEEHLGRTLTLSVEVGRYGEKGRVMNTTTMIEKSTFDQDDAIQVITHGVLLLPRNATSALLFVERANNQAGVMKLLDLFATKFGLAYRDLKLEIDTVVEGEAWLRYAQLTRVTAHRHYKDHDVSDNHQGNQTHELDGELAHTLVPKAGMKWLPRWVYEGLLDNSINAGDLLGIPGDDEEVSEVEVTLEGNGRTKTFVIGRERRPSISWPLSNHNEDAWSPAQIRNFVLRDERAKDLFDRIGIDWTESNTVGQWTDEELGAKMAIRDDEQS